MSLGLFPPTLKSMERKKFQSRRVKPGKGFQRLEKVSNLASARILKGFRFLARKSPEIERKTE
jgi:hypothetical protein